jgi:hypothetical protein
MPTLRSYIAIKFSQDKKPKTKVAALRAATFVLGFDLS